MLLWTLYGAFPVLFATWVFFWALPARHERSLMSRAAQWEPPASPALKDSRSLLVLANPFGGDRRGEWLLQHVVLPMCEKAGVRTKVVLTTHKGHARELALTVDTVKVSGAVIISGDGMLNEFLNGLAARSDGRTVLKRFPVGIVPGGTSNGMAASTSGRDAAGAMASILHAPPGGRPVDLNRVTHPHVASLVDCHVVSWGIIADHDHLVERKWRWMGKWLRSQLAPLLCILLKRTYRGKVWFKPMQLSEAEVLAGMSSPAALKEEERSPGDLWRVIEDEFTLFSVCNVRDAAHDAVFAPVSEPNDGSVHVLIMRKPSRLQLLKTFIKMGDGTHLQRNEPYIECYKVSSLILEPLEGQDLDFSGENVPLAPIRCDVDAGGMRMLF